MLPDSCGTDGAILNSAWRESATPVGSVIEALQAHPFGCCTSEDGPRPQPGTADWPVVPPDQGNCPTLGA